MMQYRTIHHAKRRFSTLIEWVKAGIDHVIARYGKPVAKLSPADTDLRPRQPGILKGKTWIADNFDDFDEELEEMVYGPLFPGE
jgi:antitoxin (DNA-binding transcriptional repressor) of toxin-antitoxin stability system